MNFEQQIALLELFNAWVISERKALRLPGITSGGNYELLRKAFQAGWACNIKSPAGMNDKLRPYQVVRKPMAKPTQAFKRTDRARRQTVKAELKQHTCSVCSTVNDATRSTLKPEEQ